MQKTISTKKNDNDGVVELLELMMQGADHMWLVWHTWATQGSIVRGDSGGAIVVRLPFRHICFKEGRSTNER